MSSSDPDKNQQARSAIQRVVEVARSGQARLSACRQETVALGDWLRSHLFRQGKKSQQTRVGRSLRSALTVRHLQERQRVHLNGGGERSGTAARARRRAAAAIRQRSG
jgi:hypothetical protein